MVYENYKEGKTHSTKEGRLVITLRNTIDKKYKVMSYPKYLMEKHLDRYFEENETVHHKDGNFLNNDLSNLEVIDRRQHSINDVIRNKDVEVTCAYCGKKFTIEGSKLHCRNRRDRKQNGYFCSRTCSGKYGAEVQQGLRENKKVEKIKAPKYKLNGLL